MSVVIPDNRIVALVGLNGAGKTTLIRTGIGALLPQRGEVFVDGISLSRSKRAASERLGWVPESGGIDPGVRLLPYLIYLARFGTAGKPWSRDGLGDLLTRVGLEGLGSRRAGSLSLGQLRRFTLATAILADPPNLLLDEVLNGLDIEGIQFFREFIEDSRHRGRSVLLSSHSLREVEALADDVAVIVSGRIKSVTPVSEVRASNSSSIVLVVENAADVDLTLLSRFGTLAVRGGRVTISSPRTTPGEVARFAMDNGMVLAEIGREKSSLEALLLE